jgi:cysteine sulfinate desulfinase/cysteine desulfurase-like protein
MGIEPTLAVGALRLSLGRWTTAEEVDGAIEALSAAILALLAEVSSPRVSDGAEGPYA